MNEKLPRRKAIPTGTSAVLIHSLTGIDGYVKLSRSSVLAPQELAAVSDPLTGCLRLKNFMRSADGGVCAEHFIPPFPQNRSDVSGEIDRCISGEVR